MWMVEYLGLVTCVQHQPCVEIAAMSGSNGCWQMLGCVPMQNTPGTSVKICGTWCPLMKLLLVCGSKLWSSSSSHGLTDQFSITMSTPVLMAYTRVAIPVSHHGPPRIHLASPLLLDATELILIELFDIPNLALVHGCCVQVHLP
jgi:hypothetical protein